MKGLAHKLANKKKQMAYLAIPVSEPKDMKSDIW